MLQCVCVCVCGGGEGAFQRRYDKVRLLLPTAELCLAPVSLEMLKMRGEGGTLALVLADTDAINSAATIQWCRKAKMTFGHVCRHARPTVRLPVLGTTLRDSVTWSGQRESRTRAFECAVLLRTSYTSSVQCTILTSLPDTVVPGWDL